MSLKITDACINCDVCEPVCPNDAIYEGELIYEIDPKLCTECVGHFDKPQCQVVCPVECIPWDEDYQETQEELIAKSQMLKDVRDAATNNANNTSDTSPAK
ncbi:MAG: YfhL family 4Fe-4S dicluster ferredoxin [Gammaproteobacteria bacterium]|nr:YfhL family 4Fe-4S dicluster ferredoxin [Gammaproteobacteria bacterium]